MTHRLFLSLALFATPAIAQAATIVHYGAGCPSPNATMNHNGLPSLGTTFTVKGPSFTSPVPGTNSLGVILVGNASTSYPVSLFGLTTCTVLVNHFNTLTEVFGVQTPVAVPNNTQLLGAQVYFQAVAIVTSFGIPTQTVWTDAIECTLGF